VPRTPYRITPLGRGGGHVGGALGAVDAGRGPDRPLAGLKVADFTAFWAGPSATHLLACLGADVVKIESVQRPDGMRFATVRADDDRPWEWSAVFHGVNANKRSVTLDLGHPEGRELAARLVRWADVVAENFSPRVMEHFGFGPEAVAALNPSAVMVRMPAFGLDGPWRDRTGFAMTVEQASGLAWQTGYEDGPPMDVGGVCDPFGGMHAVVALMAALGRRDATGEGALVELPLMEVALQAAAEHVAQFSAAGELLGRYANRQPLSGPQGVYACSDERWVAVSVTDDAQWRALAAEAGLAEFGRDPALADAPGRWAAREALDRALARWCADLPGAEVEDRLLAAGVPAAVLVVPAEVRGNEQLGWRGYFEQVQHPVAGTYRVPSLPFALAGGARHWNRTPAPTLGQHNDEVLCGLLGLAPAEVAALRAQGVVGERPVGR
jgi:crotonobetainyl-CoA:carnitine CoA-transferase CaiB-like acyl-CoA transferase